MREITLFSGKIYTAGTNFTRPPVVTVATNLNSGKGARMRKAMACACAKQWRAHGDGSCKWGMGKAKLLRGKDDKGMSFIQVSTHDFDPQRICFTHNSSASQACWNKQHFTCLCSRNNQGQASQHKQPVNVEAWKNKASLENKIWFWFWSPQKRKEHVSPSSSGRWICWQNASNTFVPLWTMLLQKPAFGVIAQWFIWKFQYFLQPLKISH